MTEYGQKNRHDVEEKDLKEFLRLQKLASEDDEEQTDGNYMLIVCLIQSFHKSRESKLIAPVKQHFQKKSYQKGII